jgi:pectate lyase
MNIKRYVQFLTEADETEAQVPEESQATAEETDASDSSKYTEVVDEVKSMIEKTVEESGGELKSFIKSYTKNPKDVKVRGFINDADIYDFYLKWRNDIDEILNNLKFFDEVPTKNNAFGIYEYVIKGTEKAFLEIVKMIK